MPQPALHLLVADDALRHWRALPDRAPFDTSDDVCINAFRHGCLAPDYGLFPGGDTGLAAIMHRGRTGALLRRVLHAARTPAQHAFACGWLTHTLADVTIHPLINRAASALPASRAVAEPAEPGLIDHVRVEVGIDVWFTWDHAALREQRLTPAFGRRDYGFVADAVLRTHGRTVTPAQLVRMQRGMILFTHAALHFATSLARDICWEGSDSAAQRYPASTMLWRVLSATAGRRTLMHAYLNPAQPDPSLVSQVAAALAGLMPAVDDHLATDLRGLPDYDLETGGITAGPARRVA